ncbi:MAG TPA: manganese efflux pump [Candidatus Baltobacteraceae bacterium]|nr:manganese efflux pump [Candidatus Baltobacteraceae bacterium]
MTGAILKVFAVALALALDVFAVSVGVGIRGVPRALKIRIGIAFAFAEIAMNVVGAGLGLAAGKLLGDWAGYIGFVALILLGAYMMKESREELAESSRLDLSRGWGLALAALSISLDSLGIGFSILYIGVPLFESLAVIGIVSVCATTLGLSLGRRLGGYAEESAAFLGGLLLALTGATFIALRLFHLG